VGWKGRAIVAPGHSFSGKTTLTTALVRAGADYYSDEYAVVDQQGRVHPYAEPLGIRDEATYHGRFPVEALGGRAGVRPIPVGLVVVSQYRSGANWRPRRLSAGQGVLALLSYAVPARRKPQPTLAALQAAVSKAVVVKSHRGEADRTAELILESLEVKGAD
jgi:hypothetical protein